MKNTTINSWNQGAEAALYVINATPCPAVEPNYAEIMPMIQNRADLLSAWVRLGSPEDPDIIEAMKQIGVMAMLWIDGDLENPDYEYIHHILVRKQRDYGHGNILRFGLVGVAVRLCDKIARLENLEKRGRLASNEAYEDTWLDILGYCAIGVMLEEGWFLLELEEDNPEEDYERETI